MEMGVRVGRRELSYPGDLVRLQGKPGEDAAGPHCLVLEELKEHVERGNTDFILMKTSSLSSRLQETRWGHRVCACAVSLGGDPGRAGSPVGAQWELPVGWDTPQTEFT